MKRCHGRLHYDRKFQIFIFLIGYININKGGFFYLIISYLRIKSYNVLNYNNCSTDWSFPLSQLFTCVGKSDIIPCTNIWKCHILESTDYIQETRFYTTTKIIYNYGLHEKLISIIIKLRKGYFPEVRRTEGK